MSCKSNKARTVETDKKMTFWVLNIQNEMDGQTLTLKNEKGEKFTTIISPANGNYIELKKGDKISALVTSYLKNTEPLQLVTKNIKMIEGNMTTKNQEKTWWIHSRKTKSNDQFGSSITCLQYQENDILNQNGEWKVLCDPIKYFQFIEGYYYKVKITQKLLKDSELLVDRSATEQELITVIERVKDTEYINPIKTSIKTDKENYLQGENIKLTMEITNTGKEAYTFLPWGTPLEGNFTGSSLLILKDGKRIPYSGIMVKRMPPKKSDYKTLVENQSFQGSVNLADGYQLLESGTYTIQFEETYAGLPASNTINVSIQ
jgi:hypothetical protein